MATATRARIRRKPARKGDDWIVVNEQVRIPTTVTDFDSFREWCRSDEYPEEGDVFWIGGTIWIEVAAEDLPTHNFVKQEIARCLDNLVRETESGVIIADRMRLVHEGASLSVEPDLMFVSTESVRTGGVRIRANDRGRILEVEGAPDMVLEAASDSSESKDDRLEELYFAAGIPEYWRIDARGSEPRFEILRRGPRGFVAAPRRAGRLKSTVFGRTFRLVVTAGPIGIPKYTLEVSR